MAAALAVAACAVATTSLNPDKLILKAKDFPAGADYDNSSGSVLTALLLQDPKTGEWKDFDLKSFSAQAGGYLGATYSDAKGHLQVRGLVITTPTPAAAKKAFGALVKAGEEFWDTMSPNNFKPMSLGSVYGDKQVAFNKEPSPMTAGTIDLIVQKHAVVWLVEAIIDRDPLPKLSDIQAELTTYAAKQKTRIGAG